MGTPLGGGGSRPHPRFSPPPPTPIASSLPREAFYSPFSHSGRCSRWGAGAHAARGA